jgi:hypothetical protein
MSLRTQNHLKQSVLGKSLDPTTSPWVLRQNVSSHKMSQNVTVTKRNCTKRSSHKT